MEYLLERLAQTPSVGADQGQGFELRAAVQAQIERVLASHFIGGVSGLSLMHFDLPSLAGATGACLRDVEGYAAQIERLIALHEPRLHAVRVRLVRAAQSPTAFDVFVQGTLQGQREAEDFSFGFAPRH